MRIIDTESSAVSSCGVAPVGGVDPGGGRPVGAHSPTEDKVHLPALPPGFSRVVPRAFCVIVV